MTIVFASCSKDSPNYATDTSSSIIGTSNVNAKTNTDVVFFETANYLSNATTYQIKVSSTLNATVKYKTSITASPVAFFNPLVLNTYSPIVGSSLNQTSKYIRFNLKYNSPVVGSDIVVFSVKDATGKVIEKTINIVVKP